jgi:hypothetical protein
MCCKLTEIAELNKPQDVWCRHFKSGTGCTIYGERPPVCRTFQCVWTLDPQLGEDWRPDRAKFVLTQIKHQLIILVDPGFPDAWRKAPYFAQIKAWSNKRKSRFGWVLVRAHGHFIVVFPEAEIDVGPARVDVPITSGYRTENGRYGPYAYYDYAAVGIAKP